MFSFLSKVSSFVLGNVVEEETAQENNSRDSASLGPEQIPQEETTTSNGIRDKVKPGELQKSFYGKVTNLYDGAGVIDHDVYFTFDVILGGFRPELGSEVHVEALRESVSSGWKATRVDHVQEWDAKGQSGTLETVVAKVTDISGNIITLNNELTINMSAMHLGNDTYSPFVGDWIKADLEKFADGSVEIRGVKPLREKHFSGKVAAACPGYGYIDDVYYTIGVCVRGYRPRRGDDVKVTAIESTQGQSKWRAILVEPKPVQSTTQSPSSGTQQFMGERMAELLANKNGIVIKDTLGFGDVAVGDCRTICIDIRNSSQTVHRLVSCCFVRADSQFQVALASDLKEPSESEESRAGTEMRLQPEQTRSVTITFTARALGRFKHLLVIGFEGFEIGRHITGNVVDDHQAYLSPSAPYSRTRKTRQTRDLFADQTDGWLVPGERPTRKVKLIFPIKLKMYTIPSDVRECLLQERDLGMVIPALRQPLCLLNYQARFSALLNAEELQMELEMRQFDLQQVEMEPFREFLCLAVPGLAEGRPSLLIGDTVVVSLCMSARDAPRYEGYIHEVRKDDILLKFNDEFHSSYGLERCDVMFFFNRSSIRRAHQAVEFSVQMGEEVLFPRSLSPKLPIVSLMFGSMETQDEKQVYMNPNNIDKGKELTMPKPTDCLYNSRLNERQRAAVARILSGQSRPTPYLLFGPPGTGKTVTLVEAMLQVHRNFLPDFVARTR